MLSPRLLLRSLVASLALLALSVRAAEPAKLVSGKPVMLFICSGQSNMAGGGGMPDYNKASPDLKLPRADIWSRNSDTVKASAGWTPLGIGGSLGPEIAFAAGMAAAHPDRTIAIVKVAKGATPIEFWTPGEPSQYNSRAGYQALAQFVTESIADLQAKTKAGEIPSFEVAGFVWMQGEGNANGVRAEKGRYQKELVRLLAFINEKAGTQNIPLVLGRISIQLSPASVRDSGSVRVSKSQGGKLPDDADFVNDGQKRGPIWYADQVDRVRADQEAFCAAYPRATMVDIDDLKLKDGYHYLPAGYVEMGSRFATAMQKLLAATPAK